MGAPPCISIRARHQISAVPVRSTPSFHLPSPPLILLVGTDTCAHPFLAQLTDIKLMSQLQSASAPSSCSGGGGDSSSGGSGPSSLAAADQLRCLARLCFSRALGACWLIPCMDLLVRVKLNIIGGLEGWVLETRMGMIDLREGGDARLVRMGGGGVYQAGSAFDDPLG